MMNTIRRDWKSVLVQSVASAVCIVGLLVALTLAFGNTQLQSLRVQRAIGCELAVPAIDPDGPDGPMPAQRPIALIKGCWTAEGLDAPAFLDKVADDGN